MVDRWIAGHHWSNQDGRIISCGLVGELSFSETFNYSHRIDMFLIYSSPHLTREREREGADPVYCNCNKLTARPHWHWHWQQAHCLGLAPLEGT